MLQQINLLRNIGQFDSVTPNQHTTLSKLALIYAENGRGKTTVAAILRSLGNNNATLITERKRLAALHEPHVVIKTNSQTYTFKNGAWSGTLADISVFDDNFVAQNVCSGVAIEAGHKQNLHELILGAQGVALNTDLQTNITKVEEHNRALKQKEAAIPAEIRGNLTVDKFCALPKNDNIDEEIKEAERNLAAAQFADAIRPQAIFSSFELPIFNIAEIEATLKSDLPNLQAQVTANIQQHLKKLGEGSEAWIGDGVQKIEAASAGEDSKICPFCTQNLPDSNIITHYESYFSESYTDLKKSIVEHGKAIDAAHGSEIQSAFERAVRLATQNVSFWQNFMEVPSIEIDTAEIARTWKAAREPILAILRTKLASPLDKVDMPSEILAAVAAYDKHRKTVAITSKTIIDWNSKIALLKEKAANANIPALTADLIRLKSIQARHNPNNSPKCQAYIDEKNAKKETEKLRNDARTALDQYRTDILGQYEEAINIYLEKFNAGFRLSSITSVNHRSGSSCSYNVLINNVSVPLTSDAGPSFKNTLSAGDRNTLALAFFFSSLDQDQTLSQKIVVIDDPMTSLDEHRTLATIQEVRALLNRTQQVIILSHSKPFLCNIWEGADESYRSALKIIRSGQSSAIEKWDVHQDCITEHDKRHALIQHYITQGNSEKEREVATALRYVLEAFMRVAYPSFFPPGTLLGNFHNKCVQALSTTLILSQADTKKLRELIDYANKFHHDTNPAYATTAINDQELLVHCKRTLKFAQRA